MNKKYLHFLGSILSIFSIIFVIFRFHAQWSSIDFSHLHFSFWLIFFLLSFFYGVMSSLLFSFSWWSILTKLELKLKFILAFRIYGLSQLAKYIPGNIFHLAGRQVMGLSFGLPSAALLKSMVWDLALSVLAGTLYVCLILPKISFFSSSLSLGLFASLVFFTVLFLRKFFGLYIVKAFFSFFFLQAVAAIIFICLLFITAQSFHFYWDHGLLIFSSYIVAWLIGLLTPGAPAGAGIREFVLLVLLKGFVSESDLLLVVMLGRMVTVLGDVLFFLFAYFLPIQKTVCMNPSQIMDEKLETSLKK